MSTIQSIGVIIVALILGIITVTGLLGFCLGLYWTVERLLRLILNF